jgi:DUF1365 family protein
MGWNSCIYRGVVRHRRLAPSHRVRLPLFMVYLDLDELDQVFDGRWFWSSRKPNLAWFRRKDHLGDPRIPLDAAVRDLVENRTGRRPEGPVRLLTHLRYFGYCLNPISLYFCYDNDQRIEFVVAEVHNTPWGERHCYILEENTELPAGKMRHETGKEFHVSPFMEMALDYRWTITPPGRRFAIHMESYKAQEKLFDVTMSLSRREIEGRTLAGTLLRYPFMTLQVLLSIYVHAGLLWLKRAQFYPHPKHRQPADVEVEP